MLENLKLHARYDGFVFLAEAARNPPFLRAHRHEEMELNLVVRGTITYVVGSQRFTFTRRSLLWMYPNQEHGLVDRTVDAQYYVAVFKPDLIRTACRGQRYAGLRRRLPEIEGVLHTELLPDAFELVRHSMELLTEDGLDADVLNRELGFGLQSDFRFEHRDPDWLNAGLRHLLLLCWRQQSGRQGAVRSVDLHPVVRQAMDRISMGEESDLASLAAACGVSESYLSRLFLRQMGVSLTRYRNSMRLRAFWNALGKSHSRSITEAVYAAGFGSYAQFFKVFKAAYGENPRASVLRRMPRVD